MLKPRLILILVMLVLLAAGWWGWREKDRVLPALINPWLGENRIHSLSGLQLSHKALGAEHLEIALASGARIQIQKLRLSRPFDLLLGTGADQSDLTIAMLTYHPTPAEPVGGITVDEEEKTDRGKPIIRLSEILHFLQHKLPQRVDIEELHWVGPKSDKTSLSLQRDLENDTVHGKFRGGVLEAQIKLATKEHHAQFSATVSTGAEESLLHLHGAVVRQTEESWAGEIQLQADLKPLTRQVSIPDPLKWLVQADGQLALHTKSLVPDLLLDRSGYRQIVAELESKALRITLPENLFGTSLTTSLVTTQPVVAELASLEPFKPQRISGSAQVNVAPAKYTGAALLQAEVDARTLQSVPILEIAGQADMQVLAPLLHSERWKSTVTPLSFHSPEGNIIFHASAELQPLGLITERKASPLQNVTATLQSDGHATVTVESGNESDTLLSRIGWQRGTWELKLDAPFLISASEWPGPIQFSGDEVRMHMRGESAVQPTAAVLQNIRCQYHKQTSCNLSISAELPQLTVQEGDFVATQVQTSAQLRLLLAGDRQQWQLLNPQLSAGSIATESLQIESPRLESPEVGCKKHGQKLQCQAEAISADFAPLKGREFAIGGRIALNKLTFLSDDGRQNASANFAADHLAINIQDQYTLNTNARGNIELSEGSIRGSGRVQAGSLLAETGWQYNLENGRGHTDFTLASAAFSQDNPLSKILQGAPLDLVSGSLSGKGKLSWPEQQGDFVDLKLDQVAATYEEIYAVGLTSKLALERKNGSWQTPRPQSITVDTLEVGFPIEKIHVTVELNQQRDLLLNALGAQLLDGTLKSERVAWNLSGEPRQSRIELSGISLRALSRKLGTENFAASGTIDVEIPLLTENNTVTVQQGRVEARPPGGRLRYYGAFSPSMLASNPQLKLISGALEDYNYRELSGTVDYPPDGDMQMQLKLVGRSDSVSPDRDLIINLNLENNIPAMLRSLRASRDLTEVLEKHLK